jgi:predicted small lipoprotein YifL
MFIQKFVFCLISILCLGACGHSGALYLPTAMSSSDIKTNSQALNEYA